MNPYVAIYLAHPCPKCGRKEGDCYKLCSAAVGWRAARDFIEGKKETKSDE